jgi:hypothetical protein
VFRAILASQTIRLIALWAADMPTVFRERLGTMPVSPLPIRMTPPVSLMGFNSERLHMRSVGRTSTRSVMQMPAQL